MERPKPANEELLARISVAFEKMLLLGEQSAPLREMVNVVLGTTDDLALRERLVEEMELAASENEELVAHLGRVGVANGERVDGSRPSNSEMDGVATAAARALSRVRGGLLDLVRELRALRRWSKYRFAWELKLAKRRFPSAPAHRRPSPTFVEPFAQLDKAMNSRRSTFIMFLKAEGEWSIRALRKHERLIIGLWWKSSRRWIRYEILRHSSTVFFTVLIGVFAVNAVTSGLEYLWGCAISLLLLIVQYYFVDPRVRRALATRHLYALGDGAVHWAQARIFAAVTSMAVESSWRRVREEERRIPPDPPSGVAV